MTGRMALKMNSSKCIQQGEGNEIQMKYYEALCLDCPNISLVK